MAENITLSPLLWKSHLSEQEMPDNYVQYILNKMEQEHGSKISLTFMSSPQSGTRYDIMNEQMSTKHKVDVFPKKDFVKIAKQYLIDLQTNV